MFFARSMPRKGTETYNHSPLLTMLWVNLSSGNMLYQLSYLILIERSINWNLIVYVDAMVNQAEYQYQVWKVEGTKARKGRELVYARIISCIPMSCTLYCYVNAKNIFRKTKFNPLRCSIAVHQNILIGCYLFENWYFDILLIFGW